LLGPPVTHLPNPPAHAIENGLKDRGCSYDESSPQTSEACKCWQWYRLLWNVVVFPWACYFPDPMHFMESSTHYQVFLSHAFVSGLMYATAPWALAALPVAFFAYLVDNYCHHGLHKYHGPSLGSVTNCWRFFDVLARRPDITQLALHRRYGDIVRLGPNTLSFGNPAALGDIYGLNKGFVKSEFYPVQQALARGSRVKTLFSSTDEQYHTHLRKSVSSAFSMSALVKYEPAVDETTRKFLDQTDALFSTKRTVCDFAEWLQWYAFDVIGAITYSKHHGFIDNAEDVDGMVRYLGWIFSYVAPV
ncbi:MAG: hypothetical protein Q9174_005270, partial [Haloplaca sp. 1 TL-2023]